ncbi:MAG TPA: hypothetical protein ENK31_00400, partial [Nannocystis exedens]|nr:hypothetical protein [Nannocystis exedens]
MIRRPRIASNYEEEEEEEEEEETMMDSGDESILLRVPLGGGVRPYSLRLRRVAISAALAMSVAGLACQSPSRGNDRWVTTENTNVDIDWDE